MDNYHLVSVLVFQEGLLLMITKKNGQRVVIVGFWPFTFPVSVFVIYGCLHGHFILFFPFS